VAHPKWELRACARKGHETYAPTDDDEVREHLPAETPAGEMWRCIRCGDFVPGPPRRSGPVEDAPEVFRGRAARDAVILRVLAVERGLRGVVLLAVAFAIERFKLGQRSFQALLDRDLPAFRDLGRQIHVDVDGSAIVRLAERAATIKGSKLTVAAVLVAVYAIVELTEAVGLWLLKRWGEYFTAVATAAFLPLEIHELVDRVTVTRVVALVINIAAVVYLVISKRLFGVRGGAAAYHRERRGESLLTLEAAAGVPA
jgi:uncharacterized membrane protein (DUF2068 family)